MKTKYVANIFSVGFINLVLVCQPMFSLQVKYFGLYGESINTIIIDTTKLNTLYVGTSSNYSSGKTGSLFRTTDAGNTWQTLLTNVTLRDIDIHPFNPSTLYATLGVNGLTKPGILKSTDNGDNWTHIDSGIIMYLESGPGNFAQDWTNPENMYVGTAGIMGGGFYKSTNGGTSWSMNNDSTTFWIGVTAVSINPDSTNIIYAGTNQSGDVYKSTNYGTNWTYTGLSSDLTYTIKIDNPSSSVYVGSAGGLTYRVGFFHSTDAGSSWKNVVKGILDTNFDIKSVLIEGANSKKRIFITGNNHEYDPRIYYKYECDTSWSMMNLPDTLPQIHQIVSFKNRVLFGTPRGLYIIEKPTNVFDKDQQMVVQLFILNQNFPNPFNPVTTISYSLSKKSFVKLSIYDLLGQEIVQLVSEYQQEGRYSLKWNASQYSSGIYLCRLESDNRIITKKIILLK